MSADPRMVGNLNKISGKQVTTSKEIVCQLCDSRDDDVDFAIRAVGPRSRAVGPQNRRAGGCAPRASAASKRRVGRKSASDVSKLRRRARECGAGREAFASRPVRLP
ncbi:hypothetical protein HMPREF0972_01660 [Actinomyces sp. oral taxon 848 str. F0332]|nr:hypothetical protein HMPREF0972_01660 [Actinomyces sp. oral taxon 848 str. F0332]